jgi:transposase
MRRRGMKRLPNLAQGELPGVAVADAPVAEQPRIGRFIDDRPEQLRIGAQRLDEYLQTHELGWVVQLRRLLERLDYSSLLVAYTGSGRPPFHPRTLLGLVVYGVLRRLWALRELEELAVRDVGAWWITGGHQPDHSTVGAFIERHSAVLTEEFFIALVQWLVRQLHVAPGVVAGDGTVIEAAASHYRTLRREAAEQAAHAAARAAAAAPADAGLAAAAVQAQAVARVVGERAAERARHGKDAAATQVAPGEPEAVLQPRKDGAMRLGYKPSTLVHECGLIVAQGVHPSSETAVVPALVAQHAAVFGVAPPTLLLDAAYCTAAVLGPLVAQDIDVLCPAGKATGADDWVKAGPSGRYGKGGFAYDATRDAYRCPAAQWLTRVGQSRDRTGRPYQRYATPACTGCALRAQCTTSRRGRTVERYDGDDYKDAMAAVLRQPAAQARYRHRAPIAERPHAELRLRQGLVRFHRRGTAGAAVEYALHCIAFDLKWAVRQRPTRCAGVLMHVGMGCGAQWHWQLILVRLSIV